MSKLFVTAVFDSAAETYFPPIFVPSKGVAIRSFMDAVSNPETTFAKHPTSFSLFMIGTFDTQSASFELLAAPQLLANAWELKP